MLLAVRVTSASVTSRHFDESFLSLMTVRLCDRIAFIEFLNMSTKITLAVCGCKRNDDEYLRAFCVCNGLGDTVVAIVWFGLTPTDWTRRD